MITDWTGLTLQTAPASEPVTVTEAKDQSRIDGTDEDTVLTRLIIVARTTVEKLSGRTLITQTWDVIYNNFPSGDEAIYLPNTPLQSVSSITYVDENGVTQTWASSNYTVDTDGQIGRVFPAYDKSYPTVRNQKNAVTVRFVSGYGSSSDVPEPIRHAILMLVGEMFERREEGIVGVNMSKVIVTAEQLLSPYKANYF